ncbi:hydroxyisourate hydrolase [Nocardia huaxiensis]|uniref:5-hydroxyisourate hydrolase n=1 Tax=Nocardia huaxiensis TaxID=2755382 RepID=A0A7D6V9H6_9NOCA|nr:hydroxyisourate hydrolase [Nocardia huaxiensis]QLY28902.1 hydroxyisourate hydrolase [Nocardia huaxiensis]UFS97622.1 hydroxyisourate hydrolase [Nocardia huaxiensis]
MSAITTHVLDTVLGRPAAGVPVRLEHLGGNTSRVLAESVTDADGRVRDLGPERLEPGRYRLTFDVESYFAATGQRHYLSAVDLTFTPTDGGHHHVPLLLSPFACSAYRGS